MATPTWPVAPTIPIFIGESFRSRAGMASEFRGGSASGAAVDDGLDLVGVEVERRVSALDSAVDVVLVDDHGDPDLRGRDHSDVDSCLGEGSEELRRDAGVRAHARADQ